MKRLLILLFAIGSAITANAQNISLVGETLIQKDEEKAIEYMKSIGFTRQALADGWFFERNNLKVKYQRETTEKSRVVTILVTTYDKGSVFQQFLDRGYEDYGTESCEPVTNWFTFYRKASPEGFSVSVM